MTVSVMLFRKRQFAKQNIAKCLNRDKVSHVWAYSN